MKKKILKKTLKSSLIIIFYMVVISFMYNAEKDVSIQFIEAIIHISPILVIKTYSREKWVRNNEQEHKKSRYKVCEVINRVRQELYPFIYCIKVISKKNLFLLLAFIIIFCTGMHGYDSQILCGLFACQIVISFLTMVFVCLVFFMTKLITLPWNFL